MLVGPSGAGVRAWIASTRRQRLLGLAFIDGLPEDRGLLIPRCRSVHTAGMRFAIDVVFTTWPSPLVVAVSEGLGPARLARARAAAASLELRAGVARQLGLEPGARLVCGRVTSQL
jgi:uncharacterized membrane protein (UPF0127 family)